MLRVIGCILFLLLSLAGASAQVTPVEAPGPPSTAGKPEVPSEAQQSMCLLLESAARANGLPVEFFARVIWQESRFRANAVGPVTRSGKRALGVAQFMPGTAAERNLLEPLDPIQALPKSAEFLQDLRRQFGNLGLAAAAYNAGPRRIREWMEGSGPMPSETRAYVQAITGTSVEQWAKGGDADGKENTGPTCGELMAVLKRARPNIFVAALEQRVIAGAMQPWGVILGSNMSRAKMLDRYAALQQRVWSKIKTVGKTGVIPSRRSLAACRPLHFFGAINGALCGSADKWGETHGVGTYPGLHYGDGGPGTAAAE